MKAPEAAGRAYEVERRVYHAVRPGFRIVEMQLGPTQTIPRHHHTRAQDTFYMLNGSIRIWMGEPDEQVILAPGQSCTISTRRPHSVENAGGTSAVFLILQGIGEHDFIAMA